MCEVPNVAHCICLPIFLLYNIKRAEFIDLRHAYFFGPNTSMLLHSHHMTCTA